MHLPEPVVLARCQQTFPGGFALSSQDQRLWSKAELKHKQKSTILFLQPLHLPVAQNPMALLILFPPNQAFPIKPPAPNTTMYLSSTGGSDEHEIATRGNDECLLNYMLQMGRQVSGYVNAEK